MLVLALILATMLNNKDLKCERAFQNADFPALRNIACFLRYYFRSLLQMTVS